MTYPFDGPEYRAEVGEGCTLPDIPEIEGYDILALEISNIQKSTGLDFSSVLRVLDLRLNRAELVGILERMARMTKILNRPPKRKQDNFIRSEDED